MTNFHSILAASINAGDTICLSYHAYEGFKLFGEEITSPELLLIARESNSLTDQLRAIRDGATEMLAHVERSHGEV